MTTPDNDRIVVGPQTPRPQSARNVDYTTAPKPERSRKWVYVMAAAVLFGAVVGIKKIGNYFDNQDKAEATDIIKNHAGPVMYSKLTAMKPDDLKSLAQGELSKKYLVVPVPNKDVHLAITAMEIGDKTPAGIRLKQTTAYATNTGSEKNKPQLIALNQASCYLTSFHVMAGKVDSETHKTGVSPEGRATSIHDYIVCAKPNQGGDNSVAILTPMRPNNNGSLSDVGNRQSFLENLSQN